MLDLLGPPNLLEYNRWSPRGPQSSRHSSLPARGSSRPMRLRRLQHFEFPRATILETFVTFETSQTIPVHSEPPSWRPRRQGLLSKTQVPARSRLPKSNASSDSRLKTQSVQAAARVEAPKRRQGQEIVTLGLFGSFLKLSLSLLLAFLFF